MSARHEAASDGEVLLETDRLLLRPWRASEAVIQRGMWSERDPRVPAHRRLDAEGRPTVSELEVTMRAGRPSPIGMLAVERRITGDVIGGCGLVAGGPHPPEPMLAFELLRRFWGQG